MIWILVLFHADFLQAHASPCDYSVIGLKFDMIIRHSCAEEKRYWARPGEEDSKHYRDDILSNV